MELQKLKNCIHYDHFFFKLLTKEFEKFKTEKNITNISLTGSKTTSKHRISFDFFRNYFLLRNESHIDLILSDLKNDILSTETIQTEKHLNSLNGLKRQIETWDAKIKLEKQELNKTSPKSIKILIYILFFDYCNQYMNLHNELLRFLQQKDKEYDFSNENYFVNIINSSKTKIEEQKTLMTQKEVANFLSISTRQVRNLEKTKHFKRTTNVGKSPRYLRSDIEEYVNIKKINQYQ